VLRLEGESLLELLKEFHDYLPNTTTKYRELHARALDAGVMVDPGYYWGKAHKGARWSVGRVLPYESICGPAGTVWHGNEVVPVADLHQLGDRVPAPGEPSPDLPIQAITKPYRPPVQSVPWGPSVHWPAITVEQWNDQCPIGTRVRYWPVAGCSDAYDTRTQSAARRPLHGEPLVEIHGWLGAVSITHLQKLAPCGLVQEDGDD